MKMVEYDLKRYGGNVSSYTKNLLKCFRILQGTTNPFFKYFLKKRYEKLKKRNGIELHFATKIGKGLYLGHPYNITINPDAIIGENCNIHKGVLIGQENRGARKGTPIIGDKVWIGINAVIVGAIHVGNDVLIAPNSYVNCNVPDHSIVFGNPCIIKHRDNATEGYINNIVE